LLSHTLFIMEMEYFSLTKHDEFLSCATYLFSE